MYITRLMVCIMLILVMLFIGCQSKQSSEEFITQRINLEEIATKTCADHGQKYILHTTPDLVEWKTLCYQESPFRTFYYKIE